MDTWTRRPESDWTRSTGRQQPVVHLAKKEASLHLLPRGRYQPKLSPHHTGPISVDPVYLGDHRQTYEISRVLRLPGLRVERTNKAETNGAVGVSGHRSYTGRPTTPGSRIFRSGRGPEEKRHFDIYAGNPPNRIRAYEIMLILGTALHTLRFVFFYLFCLFVCFGTGDCTKAFSPEREDV